MNIYLKLIWAYLKIGIFGFGGGYAMLSLVEKAVVEPGWISETTFTDIVAISQMTPGPNGIDSQLWINIGICAAAFCLAYFPIKYKEKKIRIHPILIIIMAGTAGYLLYGL